MQSQICDYVRYVGRQVNWKDRERTWLIVFEAYFNFSFIINIDILGFNQCEERIRS